MKNVIYIPFLFLLSLLYTEMAEKSYFKQGMKFVLRSPAAIEKNEQPECLNSPHRFNSHFHSESCL